MCEDSDGKAVVVYLAKKSCRERDTYDETQQPEKQMKGLAKVTFGRQLQGNVEGNVEAYA